VNVIPYYQLGRCVEFLECSKIIDKVCKKRRFTPSLGTRPVLRNTSGGTHHTRKSGEVLIRVNVGNV